MSETNAGTTLVRYLTQGGTFGDEEEARGALLEFAVQITEQAIASCSIRLRAVTEGDES